MVHQRNRWIYGCAPSGWSGSGSVIEDVWIVYLKGTGESTLVIDSSVPLMHHEPDLGSLIRIRITPKERSPWLEGIRRFLWCIMIRVILDHWSGSGSPQRNAPQSLVAAVTISQYYYCRAHLTLESGCKHFVCHWNHTNHLITYLLSCSKCKCLTLPSMSPTGW